MKHLRTIKRVRVNRLTLQRRFQAATNEFNRLIAIAKQYHLPLLIEKPRRNGL